MTLEGGCYVVGPEDLDWTDHGGWREAPVINSLNGATALSQILVHVTSGQGTPVRSFPASDVVLYMIRGTATLSISGTEFPVNEGTGAFVKKGEAFRIIAATGGNPLDLTLTVCPECPSPRRLDALPDNFDTAHPTRTVSISTSPRHAMGDRFYQVLVGEEIGSAAITQFIGAIPLSKAPAHYHHYEEAITILSGEGRMWAGEQSAPVGPGSMIFLPIRQVHSLECTDPGGLKLAGHFYPAGSPAENYRT